MGDVGQKTNGVTTEVAGYAHPAYAESLSEFGTPLQLPASGGWVLVRQIPGFDQQDAMGCYPLFACRDWSQLRTDLDGLGDKVVSLSIVANPFGDYEVSLLHECFPDFTVAFKQHHVVDLQQPIDSFVTSHHRRNVAKALRDVRTERCEEPEAHLDAWDALYSELVEQHHIRGIAAFSRSAFAKQLKVPGMVAFRALDEQDTTVAMLQWYVQGTVGTYHLGASSERGYQLRASFALFWTAIAYFAAEGLRWLNLGGGVGVGGDDGEDGLSRFKRGWSTGTRDAYFCGRILEPDSYRHIVEAKEIGSTHYFPAYRLGEFG